MSAAASGRTALVTGASSGIGHAIAVELAAGGARVHALARHEPVGPFTGWACDVTDAAAVTAVVEAAAGDHGLDVVVLAAGTNVSGRRLDQLDAEGWDTVVRTNLDGAYHTLAAARRHLQARSGDLVLIASVSAAWPDASGAAYAASKAGVLALGRAAARELQEHGVRVTTILPGLVDTALLDRRPEPPTPVTRSQALQPQDVAAACMGALALPRRACVAELTLLPTALQTVGGS